SAYTPNSSGETSPLLTADAFLITLFNIYGPYSEPVDGSTARLQENTKSCAVTGSPFSQTASSLNVNVHVKPSSLTLCSFAIPGTGCALASNRYKPSIVAAIKTNEDSSVANEGSIVGIASGLMKLSTLSSASCFLPEPLFPLEQA